MRKLIAALLIVLGVATSAHAQEPGGEPAAKDVRDKKFWVLAGALNGAMVLDTRSTFTVLRRCPDCREANPLVAPFVRRGPGVTYTAGELVDAGVMAVAAKMRASPHAWVRRTWWVLPASFIVGHGIATRHNYGLIR